jgi:hypothetical protein
MLGSLLKTTCNFDQIEEMKIQSPCPNTWMLRQSYFLSCREGMCNTEHNNNGNSVWQGEGLAERIKLGLFHRIKVHFAEVLSSC